MPGWNTSTTWMKVALVCISLGTAVFLVGFSTSAWVSGRRNYNTIGLWKVSSQSHRSNVRSSGFAHFDWFRASQAMECIGLMGLAVSLLLIIFYMCALSCKRRHTLVAMMIVTFGAVFFIVVGVAVFASKFEDYAYLIDWSMGLAIAGAILAFVAGIMQMLEYCGK